MQWRPHLNFTSDEYLFIYKLLLLNKYIKTVWLFRLTLILLLLDIIISISKGSQNTKREERRVWGEIGDRRKINYLADLLLRISVQVILSFICQINIKHFWKFIKTKS